MASLSLVCPPGMDPSVFDCLPLEIQQEIINSNRNKENGKDINDDKKCSSATVHSSTTSTTTSTTASLMTTDERCQRHRESMVSSLSSYDDSDRHQQNQNQEVENDPILGSFFDRKRHARPLRASGRSARPGAVWVEGVGGDSTEEPEPEPQQRPSLLSIPSKSNLDIEEIAFLPEDIQREIIEEERRRFGRDQIEEGAFVETASSEQEGWEGQVEEIGDTSVNDDKTSNSIHCEKQHFTYKGEYNSQGLRHGQGEIKWENGDSYKGSFSNDERDGMGMLYLANGCTYNGGWKNDMFHGSGTWRDVNNGYTYTGQYKNGQFNGRGVCVLANEDEYNGEWKDGLKDGHGIYTYSKGGVFKGMHRSGKRHGPGQYTHKDFEIDVSQYAEGRRIGVGVKWSKNKKKAWLLQDGKKGKKISTSKAKDLTFGILGHVI